MNILAKDFNNVPLYTIQVLLSHVEKTAAVFLKTSITKECLVRLQYCREISYAEARVFLSFKVSDSTDQSFLFFPTLCSADKSEVEWVTPPDLCYGIGWLARCTDPVADPEI